MTLLTGMLTKVQIAEVTGLKLSEVESNLAELERDGLVFRGKCEVTGQTLWSLTPQAQPESPHA